MHTETAYLIKHKKRQIRVWLVKNSRTLLLLAVVALLTGFSLFEIVPPISTSSLQFDIRFSEAPARPYILRVRVEQTPVDGFASAPVPRVLVSLDNFTTVTNLSGYAFFTTTPGKHIVSVASATATLPTYSTEVDVTTRITELVVRFVETRFNLQSLDVVVDTSTQITYVTATYIPPVNSSFYVGKPYLTYIDQSNYLKRHIGEETVSYLPGPIPQYRGPFTEIRTGETLQPYTTSASIEGLVQLVVLKESFIPAFYVETQLTKRE